MRIIISLITLWVLACSLGCQAISVDTETPLEDNSSPVAPPTQGESVQMTPPLSTSTSSGLEGLIQKAKEDLAQRLLVSTNQISLIEATEAEWSDSSLGCPQPGMDYLQVITPGYLIRLEVNAQTYEYHSNRDAYFVLCENSSSPSIPKP